MVPDKFNMVDMEGIDLIESQGVEVPGLYQKLVESIAQCRYQCLYNWKFDGILIPPTYVEMVATDESVSINGGVSVGVNDVVRIESLVVEPVLEDLTATENGLYMPEEGVDGFSSVEVEVNPVIQPLTVATNGVYEASEGVDGYSPVEVEVNPVIQQLTVATNGVYEAPEGVDGYSPVTVNVPSSEYQLISPVYSDLSYGFISTSGVFARYTSKTNMSNLYEVSAGDFVAFLPSVTGNRYRIQFYAGKTLSDFSEYLLNSGTGDIYNADINITGATEITDYTKRFLFSLSVQGVVYIMTSSNSQSVESILLKINS